MDTKVAKNLTIKDMQDYYDTNGGGIGTYITRKAIEAWNPEVRSGEIILPPEFACVSDRKVYTWDDVKQRRRKRQKQILERKRKPYGLIQKKPLYVWVFWCPGISGIFEGLWTYFVGLGRDYHGGGYKGQVAGGLLDEVMRLFPVCNSLFPVSRNQWEEEFVKKYTRGKHCGRPQGKAPIWAEVQGSSVLRILGRAEWLLKERKDSTWLNLNQGRKVGSSSSTKLAQTLTKSGKRSK